MPISQSCRGKKLQKLVDKAGRGWLTLTARALDGLGFVCWAGTAGDVTCAGGQVRRLWAVGGEGWQHALHAAPDPAAALHAICCRRHSPPHVFACNAQKPVGTRWPSTPRLTLRRPPCVRARARPQPASHPPHRPLPAGPVAACRARSGGACAQGPGRQGHAPTARPTPSAPPPCLQKGQGDKGVEAKRKELAASAAAAKPGAGMRGVLFYRVTVKVGQRQRVPTSGCMTRHLLQTAFAISCNCT